MTRAGHRLDKFDVPPPIKRPTTTNPWAGYLRCDECDPLSEVLGHMGVRDRFTGEVVWRDPHKPLTAPSGV